MRKRSFPPLSGFPGDRTSPAGLYHDHLLTRWLWVWFFYTTDCKQLFCPRREVTFFKLTSCLADSNSISNFEWVCITNPLQRLCMQSLPDVFLVGGVDFSGSSLDASVVAVVVSMDKMRQHLYVSHCVLFGKVAPKFFFHCALKALCNRCFDVFILCDKKTQLLLLETFERFYSEIQLLCLSAV